MPAKWQRWMPFHIDSFYGSPWVQAMHPAAQAGYLKLLAAQWHSDDCTLPAEDEDLEILSGLGGRWDLWKDHSKAILRQFVRLGDGRLQNAVCLEEWKEAKRVFEARQSGRKGKTHASVIDESLKNDDTHTQTDTYTETDTVKPISTPNGVSPRKSSGKLSPIEAIYREYPRKVGKDAALKAISRAVDRLRSDRGGTHEAQVYLFRRVQSYARSPAGNDGEFTPHPATWFNQGRYDDDPQEWQKLNSERGKNGNQGRNGFSGEQMSQLLDSIGGGSTDNLEPSHQ